MNLPLVLAQTAGAVLLQVSLKSLCQGERLKPVSWHCGDRRDVERFTSSCLWVLGAAVGAGQDQLLTGPAKLSEGAGVGAAGRDGWGGGMMDGL